MTNPENIIKHKWKKGQSGNPAGRKPGIEAIVREFIERVTQAKVNGKVQDTTYLDLMIEAQIRKSIQKQDTKAFEAIMNRTYGKPKEKIELGNPEGEVFRVEDQSILSHFAAQRPELFNQQGVSSNGKEPVVTKKTSKRNRTENQSD